MLQHRAVRIAGITTLALALGVTYAAAHQQRTVTRVGIVANPKTFTGTCPADIKFTATIFVSRHPVKVSYQWERSDGAKGERQEVEITSAGRGVIENWQLGAKGEHLHVWEKLHVLAPTGIYSAEAPVTINCR